MSTHIINFDEKTWEAPDGERYYQCREIPWWSTTGTTISRLTPYTEDSAYAHGYTEAEAKYREIRDKLEKDAYRRGYEDAKHECEANIQSNRDEAYNKGHRDGLKVGYEKLKDLEHERVEKAYKRGYDDAKHECEDCQKIRMDTEQKLVSRAYQQGLSNAWECARTIFCTSHGELERIFDLEEDDNGLLWVYHEYTASEAIERLRKYEQEQEYDNSIRNAVMDFMSKTGYNADQIMEAAEALQKKKEEEKNDLV